MRSGAKDLGQSQAFVLFAEGFDPGGVRFGPANAQPTFALIIDPIDGTRGLMHDKRSAWVLAAAAPWNGNAPRPRLADIEVAAMTELPHTRQHVSDQLWTQRGQGAHGERHRLNLDPTASTDAFTAQPFRPQPSSARDLRHGFATVCDFFPGGRAKLGAFSDELFERLIGPATKARHEVFCDQYVSSGGELAELVLGRDRMVLEIRPWIFTACGIESELCAKPYDVCTALIAQEAGCVVTSPWGQALDAPFDLETAVPFVAYANQALAEWIQPHLTATLKKHALGD